MKIPFCRYHGNDIFRKKRKPAPQVDRSRLPAHVAIIMDGNGRWAKKRGLPRTAGHAAGAETFRTIATFARDLGAALPDGVRLFHGELEAAPG